jgi:hypothetical protein
MNMKTLATLSLLILAAAPAIGQTTKPPVASWPLKPMPWPVVAAQYAIWPPVQYDKPYKGVLYVVRMDDYAIMRVLCGDNQVACAIYSETSCLIILGVGVQDNPRVTQHELGHCQGWPAHHPGIRP